MKPVKKLMTAVILLVFPILFAFTAEEDTRLTLPVRVYDGKQPVTNLQEKDFLLIINHQQQEILKAEKKPLPWTNARIFWVGILYSLFI
jgi:hypothetical protein